ncbi:hypothetical protein [Arthrobacter ramosus]|uniref:Uncharacterized protein n=1 Tax=Arthrobacter ramosus TaxID=1672 RepID=A0ABV5XYN9_ARTRM
MNPSPRLLPDFAPLSQGTRAAWAQRLLPDFAPLSQGTRAAWAHGAALKLCRTFTSA